MKLKIQNMILVLVAAAVLAVFAFSVKLEPSPDSVVILKTLGMTCANCSEKITKILHAQQGVTSAEVDVPGARVTVWYDSTQSGPERLAQSVTAIGYGSSILMNMPVAEFRAMTGRSGSAIARAGGGGCGSGCCD
jgi:copper chaperone CopZ